MLTRDDYPEGFVFGAATAACQIEGSRFGGAGPCHWDTFAANPGTVHRAALEDIRTQYLFAHRDAKRRAATGNSIVCGDFDWSRLSNLAGTEGHAKRFGLVHFDYQTQKPTPKASYHA